MKNRFDLCTQKEFFIGISMSNSASIDTGIAVINRDLELIRVDKAYHLNDIQLYLDNLGYKSSSIICMDLPRNPNTPNGKWRIESKYNKPLNVNCKYKCDPSWTARFGDRGSELCNHLKEAGYDVYRYNCYFTKNALNIIPPYKSRSPQACKYLQMVIQDQLKISGLPSNMIPLSGLDAIIGAYNALMVFLGKENYNYKIIGSHKDIPVISAIKF